MKRSILSVYGKLIGRRPDYKGPERRVEQRRKQKDRRAGTLLTREPERFGRRSGKDRRLDW